MEKLLITGASGQLGGNFIPQASVGCDVYGISHSVEAGLPESRHSCFDLTDRALTRRYLDELRPRIIVHCAAITDVERCELESEAARLLHIDVSRSLAKWSELHAAYFIYISTDSIFNGELGLYAEDDSPAPLNEYARTKLAGELAVRSDNPSALILRTNFYGWSRKGRLSLAEWMLRKLVRGEKLEAFTDVRFNPLLANELGRIILTLIRRKAEGTFHLGARDVCSKYEFAIRLANVFGFRADTVIPVSVDCFPFKASRPKDTSLSVAKIAEFIGEQMPTVEEGLREFRRLLDNGYAAALKGQHLAWLEAAIAE